MPYAGIVRGRVGNESRLTPASRTRWMMTREVLPDDRVVHDLHVLAVDTSAMSVQLVTVVSLADLVAGHGGGEVGSGGSRPGLAVCSLSVRRSRSPPGRWSGTAPPRRSADRFLFYTGELLPRSARLEDVILLRSDRAGRRRYLRRYSGLNRAPAALSMDHAVLIDGSGRAGVDVRGSRRPQQVRVRSPRRERSRERSACGQRRTAAGALRKDRETPPCPCRRCRSRPSRPLSPACIPGGRR